MTFDYSGPVSGVTLDDGTETMFIPGTPVDLPEDHPYTKTLIARGHLKPSGNVDQQKSTKKKSAGTETKKEVTDNVS